MNNSIISAVIITAIVAGSGAFYGGMQYAGSGTIPTQNNRGNSAAFQDRTGAGPRLSGMGGSRSGGGLVSGQILSRDAQGITIALRGDQSAQGGSKIVFVASSTQVTKSTQGNLDDLATGEQVTVNGTTNADGSITAQLIQVRGAFAPQAGIREAPPSTVPQE